MKTFTVYRTEARKVVNDFEKENYREGDLPQFEGIMFHDGSVAIRWFTETKSMSYWATMEDLKKVHIYAHPDYGTRIEWSDGEVETL
mgnify:FL=1